MGKGPLVAGWGNWSLGPPQAGALTSARVEVENAGTIVWGNGIFLAYHWLDERGNPIVWDGLRTTPPPLAPGERATVDLRVRAPIPPGHYTFALDLVAEHRAWLSELGGAMATREIDVVPRRGEPHGILGDAEPAPSWAEHVAAAHAEGYTVVAGAVEWYGRRPHDLDPYRPGAGRLPSFAHPLVCPSVLDGIALERVDDVAGLPAFAAPIEEPWIYDGRAVVRARPRSGRRRD